MATAILTDAAPPALFGYGLDHPATITLLATVTAHAGTRVYELDCLHGDCHHHPDHNTDHDLDHRADHDADHPAERRGGREVGGGAGGPGDGCPAAGVVCAACSLWIGDRPGPWAGQLRPECTVEAPCEVLATLAHHYGLTTPTDQPSRPTDRLGLDGGIY